MDTCNAGFDRIIKYNFGVENNLHIYSTLFVFFIRNLSDYLLFIALITHSV